MTDPMGWSNLVTPEWLAGHLTDPSTVVFDCRFDLAQPEAGRLQYQQDHIPGAVYLDLEADLSAPKQIHGGRHPLPDMAAFARTLGALGVDDTVTVVSYDDQGGCMAARLWWMLRYLGHTPAKLLDGGWSAWRRGGYPVTAEIRPPIPRSFVPRVRQEMLVGIEEVRRLREQGACLLDSRAPERYRGEVEPLDPAAGHIPGAVNLPWTDNLDARGMLKPVSELKERFAPVAAGSAAPVLYCGSGVTVCVTLLAMEEAGFAGAVLYLGGWSDWCSYPENPVARES